MLDRQSVYCPAGTPLHTLAVLELIDVGHGRVDSDGRFHGFDSCCSAQHPLTDGGCAAACAPPTMGVYRLGQPYGGGGCDGDYHGGTLERWSAWRTRSMEA